MKWRRSVLNLIATFLALGSLQAVSAEADNEPPSPGNDRELQSMAPQPQVYRSALLEKLDLVQQEIDAAQIKLKQASAGEAAYTQLDIAQQLLNQSRARLRGEAVPPNAAATREYFVQLLHNAPQGLDTARERVAGQPGSESAIAALNATQQNLDNTKLWLQKPEKTSSPEASAPAGLQAMASTTNAQQPRDNAASLPEHLSAEQKQLIRSRLAEADASLDRTLERARAADNRMVVDFVALSREYIDVIRAMTLGEGGGGSAGARPDDRELLGLMKRTEERISVLEANMQSNPNAALLAPQIEMVRQRIRHSRQQILARMAARDSEGSLAPNVDEVFKRTQAHIDRASESIQGTPDEAELRERLDAAQALLDAAREKRSGEPAGD